MELFDSSFFTYIPSLPVLLEMYGLSGENVDEVDMILISDVLDTWLLSFYGLSALVDGDDIFSVISLFILVQFIILGSISELVWPTNFLNKLAESSFVSNKVLSYSDTQSSVFFKNFAKFWN